MKSQQEVQLSDDLRQLVADQPFEPDLAAIERRGRQSRRRGLAVKGAAGLAVALVAGAAGVAVAGPGSARPAISQSATSQPAVVTAAYVVRHVEATLGDASSVIVRTTQENSAGLPGSTAEPLITEWTDPRTGNSYGMQGIGSSQEVFWESTYFAGRVLHWRDTEADYSTHTWFVSVSHAAGPVSGPLPAGPSEPGGTPQQIAQELRAGTFKIVGHGEVNGHQATELQLVLGSFQNDLWVDSTTYQPVREIRTITAGSHVVRAVVNESWIARTPALVNLANHPHPPAGFRQVAPPQ
jgi:hypothetical protein